MSKTKQVSKNSNVPYAILWALTYIICLLLLKKTSPPPALGLLLALLPVITFGVFIVKFSQEVASMDELAIRIYLEAAVIAFALCLLLMMTLGLLDLVIVLKKENWSYRHLVPYLAIFYFIGLFIAKRKYN
jgi:hypothetical protein